MGGIELKERMGKAGIEYADKSVNITSGCTMKGCRLGKDCWAYSMSKRLAGRFGYPKDNPFKPVLHENMIDKVLKLKRPQRIAISFMGEISCAKPEWIEKILDVVRQCPQHRFYFLTKRPDLLEDYDFPDNAWIGVTVNVESEEWRIEELRKINAKMKYISFEPLEECMLPELEGIDWIIIGSRTGRHPEQPKRKWVTKLIIKAKHLGIAIFMKPNLEGYEELIMEFPDVDGGRFK